MNTYTRRKGKNELHGTIVWYGVFEELRREGGRNFWKWTTKVQLTILGTFNEVDS